MGRHFTMINMQRPKIPPEKEKKTFLAVLDEGGGG
jgi:hypothetical protein